MKDVLQLAAAIVMASSAEKKNGSKSLKTIIRMKSFSDNFTVETDDEAQIKKTRSVANISSENTYFLVELKRSLEFLTLKCTHTEHI